MIAALCLIVAASWAYILGGAGMGMSSLDMSSLTMAVGTAPDPHASMPMPGSAGSPMGNAMGALATPIEWTPGYAALMFFMWWIMMIAMMLPSAAPTVLLYAAVNRKAAERSGPSGSPWSTAAFAAGYLVAWAMFSAAAATFQWAFELTGLISPATLNSTSAAFAGGILVFAGSYQLTPLKRACLEHCRGPIQFLTSHWRPGQAGAASMGLRHGSYCLGCCWGLMVILFFGGIMNLYWIIGLALVVMLEKVSPIGQLLGKALGVVLLAWGGWFLVLAAF